MHARTQPQDHGQPAATGDTPHCLYEFMHDVFIHHAVTQYRREVTASWPENHIFTQPFVLDILDEILAKHTPPDHATQVPSTETDRKTADA